MAQENRKGKEFPQVTEEQIRKIVTDPREAETLVRCARDIGTALAGDLNTNQIRAIFGEVRRIEGEWKTKPDRASRNLVLLEPKMAYRARRERGEAVRKLVSVLTPAVREVKGDGENFSRFVEFFEAILAYHKAAGGA